PGSRLLAWPSVLGPVTTSERPALITGRIFSSMLRPPPSPTLFPYTTLFRSHYTVKEYHSDKTYAEDGTWRHSGIRLRPRTSALGDRKSTRLNSSHVKTSYAVFCLKKKKRSAETIGVRRGLDVVEYRCLSARS